jgi:hypothetical protein
MARFALCSLSLLFLSLFPAPCAQTVENTVAREQRRAFAEIHIEGVANAGKLNDRLYRGTQPNERGVEELKKLGVTTIVDLRGENRGTSEHELQEAHSLGTQFVLIPGDGWAPPSDEQMTQFFSVLAERPKHTIFGPLLFRQRSHRCVHRCLPHGLRTLDARPSARGDVCISLQGFLASRHERVHKEVSRTAGRLSGAGSLSRRGTSLGPLNRLGRLASFRYPSTFVPLRT